MGEHLPNKENRRGLGPIMGPEDRHRAVEEMGILLLADEMTDDERAYFDQLRAILDKYKQFSMGKPRALPQKMLAYLIEIAKPITLDALEAETGIDDLERFMVYHRQFTVDERRILGEYFEVDPAVFVNAPEDCDYDD